MKYYMPILTISILAIFSGCRKDFLDTKPSSSIIQPNTLSDFRALLENNSIITWSTGGLPQLASDEYYYQSNDGWLSAETATERQTYIWAKDTYGGDATSEDWNEPYQVIYYANNVLDGLAKLQDSTNTTEYDFIKGWAYFIRSYALYDLAKNFSLVYDSLSATTDLGIPLRLKSGIVEVVQRSSLEQTFEQILLDCKNALILLPSQYPSGHLNHPSKMAGYALLARVYLYMGNYNEAGRYADSCLQLYNTLIDYNTVSTTATTPFTTTCMESIYTTAQVVAYPSTLVNLSLKMISVDSTLLSSYEPADLRRDLYFKSGTSGNVIMKRGYTGTGLYAYTGLAVDEMFLIRSECKARLGNNGTALDDLNTLLSKRYVTGSFNPLTNANTPDILAKILLERRKELVWRGIRWSDLKRLNRDGANITITRMLDSGKYTLLPNDPRYAFNIPADEITLSGIAQNDR